MTLLYVILLGVACFLLLVDAFSGTDGPAHRGGRFTIRLLPFALALVVFVWFLQLAKTL